MDDSLLAKFAALGVKIGGLSTPPALPSSTESSIENLFHGKTARNPFGECTIVVDKFPRDYQHGQIDINPRSQLGFIAEYCRLPDLVNSSTDSLVFLDTETTGLSSNAGTFPFLTGVCRSTSAGAETALFLCRSQADEPAMLDELYRYLYQASAVVTYNGKSFDIPLLESRYQFYGMQSPFQRVGHIDLLHITREIWKRTLPSRSLGYIEMSILGVCRGDEEVPGYLIPQLYYDYLKSQDARPLVGVLYHNKMDILSLIALLNYLLDVSQENLQNLNPVDILAIIQVAIKSNDMEQLSILLDQLLDIPLEDLDWSKIRKLSDWLTKHDRDDIAFRLLQKTAYAGDRASILSMTKYYEYQVKDYSLASFWCDQLEIMILNSKLAPFSLEQQMCDLSKRRDRIKKKLSQSA